MQLGDDSEQEKCNFTKVLILELEKGMNQSKIKEVLRKQNTEIDSVGRKVGISIGNKISTKV